MNIHISTIKMHESLNFNNLRQECYREFLRASEILNLESKIQEELYFNFTFDLSKIRYILYDYYADLGTRLDKNGISIYNCKIIEIKNFLKQEIGVH